MTRRNLTDEEKALLGAAMQDVQPLDEKKRLPTPAKAVRVKPSSKRLPPAGASNTLDLHGMTMQQAYSRLRAFIEAHSAAGRRDLLVITGKGKGDEGTLQREVPRWLMLSDMKSKVAMVSKASPQQGGEGALCVRLKWKRK